MRLTIDRGIWDRGGTSQLLRHGSIRRQCCVGIFLSALKVKDARLRGIYQADQIEKLPAKARFLVTDDIGPSDKAVDLYDVNDAECIEGPERERRIAELFAAQGIDVEFVGGEEDA